MRKIKLPNGRVALMVKRDKLSKYFNTKKDTLAFLDSIRCKKTGVMYRRADARLSAHTPNDEEILVENG